MIPEYEHLITDISYAALRVVSRAVRTVVNGTTDMTVQVELNNFANECDNRIQHHDREVQKEVIAKLNAEHNNPPPIALVVVDAVMPEGYEDLI